MTAIEFQSNSKILWNTSDQDETHDNIQNPGPKLCWEKRTLNSQNKDIFYVVEIQNFALQKLYLF